MAESKSIPRDTARWSARSADHVTRSNRHDRYADQRYPKGDDAVQCSLRGDNAVQCSPKGDDAGQ